MKKLFLLLLLVVSLAQTSVALAEYIDLREGGIILEEPTPCRHNGKVYICVPVGKNGRIYMVLGDKKGEAHIYEIIGQKIVLVWSKDIV